MADNYLERKMEDYRSGKLALKANSRHRGSTLIPATGYDVELIGAQRVLVVGDCKAGVGLEMLKMYRSYGCKVAFCDTDSKQGAIVGQKHGCRFYPVDVAQPGNLDRVKSDLNKQWGGLDVTIVLG
ncbi:MAG: SDR family oxidoreductase [Duncaniella sp.]|nr:SDR family oxidoreductase [Muribaculum sp.]MCM1256162.1 SDR family oxidoreductase [Duncaniella sp.]